MKILISAMTVALLFSGVQASGRGVDSSGGTFSFIESVQRLQPLGQSYGAAELNLVQQGYQANEDAEIVHHPSVDGIEVFEIRQVFSHPNCSACSAIAIRVNGRMRVDPPKANEEDVFLVDSFVVEAE